ncbi:MAG: hypothetical protein ACOX9C_02040 [Kiritimatiellia bacterium]
MAGVFFTAAFFAGAFVAAVFFAGAFLAAGAGGLALAGAFAGEAALVAGFAFDAVFFGLVALVLAALDVVLAEVLREDAGLVLAEVVEFALSGALAGTGFDAPGFGLDCFAVIRAPLLI